MPTPARVIQMWRAMDELVADVAPTTWGAVIVNADVPRVWDANYARLDKAVEDLHAEDVEADLLPSLRHAGVNVEHVVSFHPELHSELLGELSARGHGLGWDVVMEAPTELGSTTDVVVEELSPGPGLWEVVGPSLELFGPTTSEAIEDLLLLERDVLTPAGKRWFGVRNEQRVVALAALVLTEAAGYVDNVATFPAARGRGFASAATAKAVAAARAAGVETVYLLADPDAPAVVRMYERLGFKPVASIASTRGPVPAA